MSDNLGIIEQYISDTMDSDQPLDHEEKLFSAKLLDSMDLVGLIGHLESEFSIKIDPADVNHDNFDTISRIATYVDSKSG